MCPEYKETINKNKSKLRLKKAESFRTARQKALVIKNHYEKLEVPKSSMHEWNGCLFCRHQAKKEGMTNCCLGDMMR